MMGKNIFVDKGGRGSYSLDSSLSLPDRTKLNIVFHGWILYIRSRCFGTLQLTATACAVAMLGVVRILVIMPRLGLNK